MILARSFADQGQDQVCKSSTVPVGLGYYATKYVTLISWKHLHAARLAWKALMGLSLVYAAGISVLYLFQMYPRHRVESGWLLFAGFGVLTAVTRFSTVPLATRGKVDRRRLLLALAGAALLYAPSFTVGLLSDDFTLLAVSDRWQLAPVGWEHFRPLPLGVWALLLDLGLGAPTVLHALNIGLHGVNAYFTYGLAREIGLSERGALTAGALFLAFPGSVEPVTWVSSLQDVLMTALVLGFLLAVLRDKPVVAFACLVAATLTKETAVCAPILLLLLRTRRKVSLRLLLAAIGWALLFAFARLWLKPAEGVFDPIGGYFMKELLVRIYGGLAVPWTRQQMFAYPWMPLAALLGIVALLGLPLWRLREKRLWTITISCAILVLVSALPVYRYFYVSPELQGTRYLYLPSVGWSLMLAVLADEHLAGVRRLALSLILAVSVAGVLLQQQRWREAAVFRNAVLAQATTEIRSRDCTHPQFANGPDSYNGVYVFRNGLNEALAGLRLQVGGGPPDCVFEWRDSKFHLAAPR